MIPRTFSEPLLCKTWWQISYTSSRYCIFYFAKLVADEAHLLFRKAHEFF